MHITYQERIHDAINSNNYSELRTIASEIAEFDEAQAHTLKLKANMMENEEWAYDRAVDNAL